MEDKVKSSDQFDLIHKIPQWFIGIVGLIYLTGFLVMQTHLARFGIRDAGGELFRLKFIQIGLLYFIPELVLVVPVLAIIYIRTIRNKLLEDPDESIIIHPKKGSKGLVSPRSKVMKALVFFFVTFKEAFTQRLSKLSILEVMGALGSLISTARETLAKSLSRLTVVETTQALVSLLIIVVFLSVFNAVLFFAPHHFVQYNSHDLLSLTFITLIGLFISSSVLQKSRRLKRFRIPLFARLIVLAAVVFYSWKVLTVQGLLDNLKEVWALIPTKLFIGMVVLSAFLIYRIAKRNTDAPVKVKPGLLTLGICFTVTFYFFNIIAFSLSLFAFIPSHRGGGDYLGTPNSILHFRDNYEAVTIKSIPKGLYHHERCLYSKTVKIIYENPSTLYVAIADDAGGPAKWRTGAQMPEVFAVRRESINNVSHKWEQNGSETGRGNGEGISEAEGVPDGI